MSSFSCPHYNVKEDACILLKTDCVPGRKGCVLARNSKFAFSVEERIRRKEADKKRPGDKQEK